MAKTTKLYGEIGRHRKLQFTYEGKALRIRFVGADYKVEIDGFGDEIPIPLAEALHVHPGTGIRFPGGEPADAGNFEEYAEKVAAENASKPDKGEAADGAIGVDRSWPRKSWAKDRLIQEGIRVKIKRKDLEELNKDDIFTAVCDKLAEQYPAWAEQEGYVPSS